MLKTQDRLDAEAGALALQRLSNDDSYSSMPAAVAEAFERQSRRQAGTFKPVSFLPPPRVPGAVSPCGGDATLKARVHRSYAASGNAQNSMNIYGGYSVRTWDQIGQPQLFSTPVALPPSQEFWNDTNSQQVDFSYDDPATPLHFSSSTDGTPVPPPRVLGHQSLPSTPMNDGSSLAYTILSPRSHISEPRHHSSPYTAPRLGEASHPYDIAGQLDARSITDHSFSQSHPSQYSMPPGVSMQPISEQPLYDGYPNAERVSRVPPSIPEVEENDAMEDMDDADSTDWYAGGKCTKVPDVTANSKQRVTSDVTVFGTHIRL